MALKEIDVRGTTTADPEAVWQLLGDSSTWPDWTPIDEYEPERPGGADGTGEIRRFRTGRHRIREEIVERADGRRLTYALLSGLALRDYRAEIDLTGGDRHGDPLAHDVPPESPGLRLALPARPRGDHAHLRGRPRRRRYVTSARRRTARRTSSRMTPLLSSPAAATPTWACAPPTRSARPRPRRRATPAAPRRPR
jgi:hypothetical protein